jgi:GMP reductase
MKNEQKFDLRDVCIVPAIMSPINSRSECIPYYENEEFGKHLPLMASPMDTVVCEKNYQTYIDHEIIPCIPRGLEQKYLVGTPHFFQALGLKEIEEDLNTVCPKYLHHYPNILIDIANGHMNRLIDVVKKIKQKYPNIQLMVGNVAHPLTYKNLAMSGVDYVRCSIGTGAGCTTAANVAINYPMGSLITECRKEKIKGGFWNCKIVADGGMQGYDDIIKALALGADYVMIGSLFNKAMQSAGFNYLWGVRIKSYHVAKTLWKWGFPIKKKYRGMSTKAVQRKWGRTKLVTAEGITKYQKIEYNLSQWVENFKDYFRSNMSYCGAKNLNDFIGEVEWEYITNNALKRFQK